jgi:uncharacterized protein
MKILADLQATTPWKNGGGQARDLLLWPTAAAWCVRISLADIGTDGPFSAWPGITRWFAVTQGAGVRLQWADGRLHTQACGDAPLCFDGAQPPLCQLVDGPAQALNLMLRNGPGGATGVMQLQALAEDWPQQGRYDPPERCLHWPARGPGAGLHLGARCADGAPAAHRP